MKRFALALVLTMPAVAAAHAGTNLPALADYPGPNCSKGQKPDDVPASKPGEDVAAYARRIKQHNQQVTQYNADLHQFTSCMDAYVSNAQADLNLIRDKVNAAVAASQPAN